MDQETNAVTLGVCRKHIRSRSIPISEPVIFRGVCAVPLTLSSSFPSRAWLGHLVIGEEGHIPQFLTGSPSPELVIFFGVCGGTVSISLSCALLCEGGVW